LQNAAMLSQMVNTILLKNALKNFLAIRNETYGSHDCFSQVISSKIVETNEISSESSISENWQIYKITSILLIEKAIAAQTFRPLLT